jgi:hypothetical protein
MKMSFIRYKASSRDILWLTWFANKLIWIINEFLKYYYNIFNKVII